MKNIKSYNKIISVIALIILAVILGIVFYFQVYVDNYKATQDESLKTVSSADYKDSSVDSLTDRDKVIIETTGFEVLDNEQSNYLSLIQQVKSLIKDKYPKWDDVVTANFKNKEGTALKGKWVMGDSWDWIAYREIGIDKKWIILISFDGFDCKQIENIPEIYRPFFEDKIYMFDSKYCYNH